MCCGVCDKEINTAIMCKHKWGYSIYMESFREGGEGLPPSH